MMTMTSKILKKGVKIRIRVNDTIQADYPDLKKRFYRGKILGRKSKENMFGDRAFRVKFVGEQRERVFFDDEMETLRYNK